MTKLMNVTSTLVLAAFLSSCATQQTTGDKTYAGHGAESVSKDVIDKFAPAPLPKDLSERVRNMLEVQAPGLGMITSNGKTLYFTWSITGVPQVWKTDGPLRFPEQMSSGADPTYIADITLDEKYLIVSRDRAGEENPGLYLLPTKGGELIQIQHKKGVQTRFGALSPDGETIYFLSNDIKPDSYAIYSYSIETKEKELIFSEPGLWFIADTIGYRTFLLGKSTGALTAEYSKFDLMTKKLTPVLGQGEKEEYEATFGTTENELFVLTPKLSEFRRLYRVRDGKFDPISPDVKMDVESFSMPFNRFRLYVQYNDGGFAKLEAREPHSLKVLPLPKFPNADHVFAGKSTRMGRYVTLGVETGTRPRTSYVFDWRTGELKQWVRPSIPEFDVSRFVASQLEYYPARDGAKIPMLVTRPTACEKKACPVVVSFHGGPEGQSRPGFNRTAQLFAMSGFIYIEPNVRGSDGYGKAWLHADDGAKRLDVITDIEDIAKYLRSTWVGNGKATKIGVMGGSYGGYSTLMAMTRFAGNFDAGVAIVGMSDLRTFLANTAPYRRILRTSEYGDLEKDAEALTKLSPVTYLDQIRDPLMIIQGVSDPRVPVGEAVQFKNALDKKGIAAPLILFSDEGHGSIKRENRVLELGHTLQFFQQHLN